MSRAVLIEHLRTIASAEDQLMHAMPKAARAAQTGRLRADLSHHLLETEGQIDRLHRFARDLKFNLDGGNCEEMARLIADARAVFRAQDDAVEGDLKVVAALRPMEQLEIRLYETAIAQAEDSGENTLVPKLRLSLEEEQTADRLLEVIAGELRAGTVRMST